MSLERKPKVRGSSGEYKKFRRTLKAILNVPKSEVESLERRRKKRSSASGVAQPLQGKEAQTGCFVLSTLPVGISRAQAIRDTKRGLALPPGYYQKRLPSGRWSKPKPTNSGFDYSGYTHWYKNFKVK